MLRMTHMSCVRLFFKNFQQGLVLNRGMGVQLKPCPKKEGRFSFA